MKTKTRSVSLSRQGHQRSARLAGSLVLFFLWGNGGVMAGVKTGADFLKIPVGAEATGLGQAYSAMSTGVNSLNWNPAGLSQSPIYSAPRAASLALSHQEHFIDTRLDHMGLALPVGTGRWAAGLSVLRLSHDNQERRTLSGEQEGSFGASDMSVGLAMARNFGTYQLGTQVKMIQSNLAGYDSRGMAVDLGAMAQIPSSRLALGASVRNLGPKMKFIDEEFQLPLSISLGAAFRLMGPISVMADVQSRPHENQVEVSFGSEYLVSRAITLRAGYLTRVRETIENGQESETNRNNPIGIDGLAGGMGLHFRQFAIDYSITPFGEQGNRQSFSIATWFGGAKAAESPTVAPADDRDIMILPPAEKTWWNLSK